MNYSAISNRYENMLYRNCGHSGLQLPAIALGLWQNFSEFDEDSRCRDIILAAFDQGVTHFDLANNYGPPPGFAEARFGKILSTDLAAYRDEMIIATKAGYDMWPGPYGNGGSRKYLLSSLDQSLRRLRIPYVDIFYSHRPDPQTPIEETMLALDTAVRQGKALYAGISNYNPQQTEAAIACLHSLGTPFIIHQMKCSLLHQEPIQSGLFSLLQKRGIGAICFSPLAQGLLTDKYLNGIPVNSRAAKSYTALSAQQIQPELISRLRLLQDVALRRGQSLAQMSIAWLWHQGASAVLIGASSVNQLNNSLGALSAPTFSTDELATINAILA